MKKIVTILLIIPIFFSAHNTYAMLAKQAMPTGRSMLTAIARTSNISGNMLAQVSPRYATISSTASSEITIDKIDLVDKKTKKATHSKSVMKHKKTNVKASKEHDLKDLMCAAQSGHTIIIEALSATGININVADEDGMTALMWAAKEGRIEAIRLLLAMKADSHATDNNGFTAWMHAIHSNQTEIAEILFYARAESAKIN